MQTRRSLMKSSLSFSVLSLLASGFIDQNTAGATTLKKLSLTDAEWKKRLTPQQFQVLRHDGTEHSFTSLLLHETRSGIFACAGCALPLFSSTTKFDSGTGWPSFWRALDHAIVTKTDMSLGYERTAVICRRCDGHLGHVFDDGPKPTGKRFCMNGVALTFRSAAA